MTFVLVLASILFQTSFETTIDRAFTLIRNNNLAGAASVLDEARITASDLFDSNNLHYLRGRIAEDQREWQRAVEEFDGPAGAVADRGGDVGGVAAGRCDEGSEEREGGDRTHESQGYQPVGVSCTCTDSR